MTAEANRILIYRNTTGRSTIHRGYSFTAMAGPPAESPTIYSQCRQHQELVAEQSMFVDAVGAHDAKRGGARVCSKCFPNGCLPAGAEPQQVPSADPSYVRGLPDPQAAVVQVVYDQLGPEAAGRVRRAMDDAALYQELVGHLEEAIRGLGKSR